MGPIIAPCEVLRAYQAPNDAISGRLVVGALFPPAFAHDDGSGGGGQLRTFSKGQVQNPIVVRGSLFTGCRTVEPSCLGRYRVF